ncbi:MAG: Ribosome biogenesis protein erb1 [Vezdaea aestivalis]|nr:MAG: Ribosome biogenesis protein erb1 [Vezdaea aestivalis]
MPGKRKLSNVARVSNRMSAKDGVKPELNGQPSTNDHHGDTDPEDEANSLSSIDDVPEFDPDQFSDNGSSSADDPFEADLGLSDQLENSNDARKDRQHLMLTQQSNLHDDSDSEGPNYTVTKDANGNPRYLYREIDPVYASDDSDAPPTTNTIGNIPSSFYDAYPHIGYTIDGAKVMRPAKGAALDSLLDSIEIPKGWTGLTDPATGLPLKLSQEEQEILKKIHGDEPPVDGFDPYPATIEYFTGIVETMPLSAAPEPKRRFIPSKHEAKRVMKIVRAIREGRILPYRPPIENEDDEDAAIPKYDLWSNEVTRPDHPMNIPAPKLAIPSFDQSYNPPREYLPSKAERQAWEEADEEDREREFLPAHYDALRKTPGYSHFVKERHDRCLDLYLAPRIRRSKLNIDPESLLPKLPSPEELRPFPTACTTIYKGDKKRVRSLCVDPSGRWLASGGDDGTVRIWEILTGRNVWSVMLSSNEAINVVRWRPTLDTFILAAAVGDELFLIVPPLASPDIDNASYDILDQGFGYAANKKSSMGTVKKADVSKWARPQASLVAACVPLQFTVRGTIKVLSWHRRGDFLATCAPAGQKAAISISTISKHLTQYPFRGLKGLPQSIAFHPTTPVFFIATQNSIRAWNLQTSEPTKTMQPSARWVSSIDIHPSGEHILAGSFDRRTMWHDIELQPQPYKTLRYHSKAVRAVRFHQGAYPLFADASDDGTVQIVHGKVFADAIENASIVPVKVLRGHRITDGLGVLDLSWHSKHPWIFSSGADGTCRFWS